jgi:hypothetical protein
MTRGSGKHQPRQPTVAPNTAAGRDIGLSDRQTGDRSPVPGGRPHIGNHPTVRQSVATAAPRPEFRGVMAHGVVPGPQTAHERAEAMRGPNTTHDPRPVFHGPGDTPPPPVPVYLVSRPNAEDQITDWSPRRLAAPATGTEPVHLVGKNSDRVQLLLLNEDASHHILISNEKAGIVQTTSAVLLPKGMTNYLKFPAQTDIWIISADSGTPTVSVIEIFAKNRGQRP